MERQSWPDEYATTMERQSWPDDEDVTTAPVPVSNWNRAMKRATIISLKIINLTPELLLDVAEYLPQSDLCSLHLTCRTLRPIAQQVLHYSPSIPDSSRKIVRFLQGLIDQPDLAKHVKSLTVRPKFGTGNIYFNSHTGNICFNNIYFNSDRNLGLGLVPGLCNLKILHLYLQTSEPWLRALLLRFPALKSLTITVKGLGHQWVSLSELIRDVRGASSTLESLELDVVTFKRGPLCLQPFQNLRRLKVFFPSLVSQLPGTAQRFEFPPSIEIFELTQVNAEILTWLQKIRQAQAEQKLPNLREIRLFQSKDDAHDKFGPSWPDYFERWYQEACEQFLDVGVRVSRVYPEIVGDK